MLPDFPEIKKQILKLLQTRMQSIIKGPVISQLGQRILHEGSKQHITRADGSTDQVEYESIESKLEIRVDEFETMSFADIVARVDQCALEMARQQAQKFYALLKATTDATGNVVDGKSQPPTPELYLQAIDGIPMEFTPSGTALLPSFIGAPEIAKALQDAQNQVMNDPALRIRLEQIIMKKKEVWRARESNRRLVG